MNKETTREMYARRYRERLERRQIEAPKEIAAWIKGLPETTEDDKRLLEEYDIREAKKSLHYTIKEIEELESKKERLEKEISEFENKGE